MSAVARWREVEGHMPFVRGRLPAAVPAVLGAVLAAATIIWPVMRISQPIGPDGPSAYFAQQMWSWGRYSIEGADLDQVSVTNVAPAYWLGLACLSGLLGGLTWLLRRGPDGRALGGAGVAFALAVVGGSLLERLGTVALYEMAETGLELETLPAGRVELAAAVLLLIALVLMVWRPVLGLARQLVAVAGRVAARGRQRADEDEDAEREAAGRAPRVGTAVLRDAGASSADRGGGPGRERNAGVGFTDGATPEDRFRPPAG
ncbi:hypothetical protein FHX52_4219 [Humibacillus xanthopallidus]|uniref:Uncharacterized protein n=1 Tax=Humibacillus xanthopallidus TaxID=412689 RepID=A0A543PLQ4_9MICO|nr:hypothetical protein [Humibacillus xanthopallidus]TQN44995.1 hypothetical protein FHX52_4219 [Humibacillus xanthopallidus]